MSWIERLRTLIKIKWISYILSFQENDYDVYQIKVKNTSNTDRGMARLFGYNLFFGEENFGSDPCIEITSPTGAKYKQFLIESQRKTFVKQLNLMSHSNRFNRDEVIQFIVRKANGRVITVPFSISDHLSPYQYQHNIISILMNAVVDGSTYLEMELDPKEEFTFIFLDKKSNSRW